MNKISITSLIRSLYEENFFVEPKYLKDVSNALVVKGYHVKPQSVHDALMRAVRSKRGYLGRQKVNGHWHYVQKHPVEPAKSSKVSERAAFFEKYDLHPKIKQVAYAHFQDGYFKEAIQNALVEVIDQVKLKANNPTNKIGRELDGDDLMNQVFGCDNQEPLIKFNKLRTSLDKAEQRGTMYLFKGVVGIRDKKAHLNFVQKDPLKTIEYLSLASLLMRLLDEA